MQSDEYIMNLIAPYENKEEILEEFHKLSPEEEIEALSNLIGYSSIPVDIETFVKDPYYLGEIYGENLYPIWLERLKLIFPDPIRTSATFMSVKGAIGTGKSTFSLIVLSYDYYKFSLISDPYKFLHLAATTSFSMRFYNVNIDKSNQVFIQPLNTIFNRSPYFRELHRKLGGHAHGIRFLPASQPRHALSECIVSSIISETNFFRNGVAEKIIDNVTSRLESRMQIGFGYLPHVILDSSDTVEDSAVENYIRNSPYSNEMVVFSTPIWTAKSHLSLYFNRGSFRVYAGDGETPPFIFDEKHPIDESNLDKDRIITCPNEVRNSFEQNIELALQEKVGISIKSTDNFILDKETVKSRFDLPMVTDEEIVVDFYDKESIWSIVGDSILEVLPVDRRFYFRLDLGVSHDMAGIAISYFDGYKYDPITDKSVTTYKVPVAFDIGRIKGQETPITKIKDFVLDLAQCREIALITTDQYQSTNFRQDLRISGFESSMLSVDRTTLPYITLKNLFMEDRCHCCANMKLRREILDLKRVGNKIDHTSAGINCFSLDTEICTPTGKYTFEYLINHSVTSLLVYTYQFGLYLVSEAIKPRISKYATELMELVVDGESIICTPDHLFNTKRGWVKAEELLEDDVIIGREA